MSEIEIVHKGDPVDSIIATISGNAISALDNRSELIDNLDEKSTSIFIFDIESQKLLCTEAYKSSKTSSIPEAIKSNWYNIEQSDLSFDLYSTILKLANKPNGWRGGNSKKLISSSLSEFLNFWQSIKSSAIEPEVVLLPNGNIQAEWYKNDKHFLEIEFGSDQMFLFGLFDGKKIYEGRGKLNDVITIAKLNSSKALNWAIG
ncbi:MAG: hypothetical protein HQ517_04815 [SAR324 cluster bacterium]|nr:hypothetical protein [SAR324 cluster bacterium]